MILKLSSPLVLTLLFAIPSVAKESISYKDELNGRSYETVSFEDVLIGPQKICKKFQCEAARAIKEMNPASTTLKNGQGGINPTTATCTQINGVSKTFLTKKKAEVSVCVFQDGSFLNIWEFIQHLKKD